MHSIINSAVYIDRYRYYKLQYFKSTDSKCIMFLVTVHVTHTPRECVLVSVCNSFGTVIQSRLQRMQLSVSILRIFFPCKWLQGSIKMESILVKVIKLC